MEKVAGVRRERTLGRFAAVALGFIAACPLGWAQEAASSMQDRFVAEAPTDQGFRLEVNRSALPRIDAQDSGFQAPRVDLSLAPRNLGLGVVLGMSNVGLRSAVQPNNFASQPSMDLGLRWRQVVQSKQVDVTAWRRMTTDDDAYSLIQMRQPMYGARVEMKLGDGNKSRLVAGRGFLGFQLESGAKITVKRKDGRPMFYYRSTF